MMDFDDDFGFIHHDIKHSNLNHDYDKDIFDFPLFHSTPSLSRSKQQQQIRSLDYPSVQKHYGLVTFADDQLPIIYRLINDTFYIPYIRFSYVRNILQHSTYKNLSVNIRNLPVIEMTAIEKIYYDQLSSSNNDSDDWSNYQLLSVSMLDGILAIINLTEHFHCKCMSLPAKECTEWQEALNTIRQEAYNQWILDEKIVLSRLVDKKKIDSTCISSTASIAKRRALLEERLDLSIVDGVGGFVQIDSYVYPFVKNPVDNQIYINLDDIRQNYIPLSSYMISYGDQNSPMYRAYSIVMEQAETNYEWNTIRRGRTGDLSKYLPSAKRIETNLYEAIPFLPLQTLLHLFLNKNSDLNLQFVQIFETSSLDEIEFNYKNNVARQFIMTSKRQGGFVNSTIPCLIYSHADRQMVFISNETKTQRTMTSDERLYLNIILLYHGLWKNVFTQKKQWYLKEINSNDKENFHVEIVFGIDK